MLYRKLLSLIADLIVCDSWASVSLCICVVVSPELALSIICCHLLLLMASEGKQWPPISF